MAKYVINAEGTKKARSTKKFTDIFQSIWDAVFMKDFMWEKTPIFQIQTV